MTAENGFGLSLDEEASMTRSVVVAEALDVHERLGDWEKVAGDAEFRRLASTIIGSEFIDAISTPDLESAYQRFMDDLDAQVQRLVESGVSEKDARLRVDAEVVREFVEGRLITRIGE